MEITMRKLLSILILIIPLMGFANTFSVLSENQDALKIKFVMPAYHMEPVDLNGNKWSRIVCDEGMVYGEDGYPELKVFSIPVAIPVDGDISYSVNTGTADKLQSIKLKPVATITLDEDVLLNAFSANSKAYRSTDAYPLQMVTKGEAAFIGNRRFIPLMICPFQYFSAKGELDVYTEITINIQISGSKGNSKNWQTETNPLDNANPPFFVNESSSRGWRLPKSIDNTYSSPKSADSGVSEIQLVVDQEGIYKVSYQYLMDMITEMVDSLQVEMAWTPASVDPRYLELSDEYGQVPIHFIGETDGSFDPGDYFEFFGEMHKGDTGYMDDYTSENVYTLALKDTYGARMVVENGGLIESNSLNYIVPDAYQETVHFEQQVVSDKLGRGWTSMNPNFYREDVWFWKKINAPNLEIVPIQLQYPKETTIRTASAKISLMGLTYSDELGPNEYDHDASIRLNQAMVNSHHWTGQTEKIFENAAPISNTFLYHGTNNLYISLSGNTAMGDREQVLLDYAEITYWREYKTDQDYIKFTKPSNRPSGLYQFQLQGFSSSDVSVYKIGSSVFNSMQIEPFNLEGIAPWTVTFQDSVSSNAVRYYAVAEAQKKIPKQVRLNFPSDLRNHNNSADILVLTPKDFTTAEGTQQLKSIWEAEGYQVKIVDIQDIYDEFNHGIVAAEPIKAFISYAYNNWNSPQPSHVFLLGEGVDDTRDNSPSRMYNVVPVKKVWTYKHGATASDNWYACIVGNDIVPDIAISRLNVWRADQILDYAAKAESYHSNPQTSRFWNSNITYTSGGKITDANDVFAQQSEKIRRQCVPSFYRVNRVYTSTQTVSHDYFGGTFTLKDDINNGTQYVQFMGHGGGRIWSDYNLFNFNDVATLNNTTYPVVLSLACYASSFDTNGMASISEALVMQPGKGSIGSVGFTGLGYLDQDEDWGLAFNEALFTQDFPTIGQAMIYSLARFYTTTSSTAARYALTNAASYLGDPLIKLRKPVPGIQVTADDYVLSPGDTLTVHAQFPTGVNAARLYIMKDNEKVVNIPYDLPVMPDGRFNASYVSPDSLATGITRKIYIAGAAENDEYIGTSVYSVGRPAVIHNALNPLQPAWADSVSFSARVFSPGLINSMICKVCTDSVGTNVTWITLPMEKSATDSTLFITAQKLPPQRSGKEIMYKYIASGEQGNSESFKQSYVTRGPDLFLNDIQLDHDGQHLMLKVRGTNIGNAASIATDLQLYKGTSTTNLSLFSTQPYNGLEVGEVRWDTVYLDSLESSNVYLEVRVNSSSAFQELHLFFNTNNIIGIQVPFNYHFVSSTGSTINSVDNNLSCQVPPGLVSGANEALFAVNALSPLLPLNQPDVHDIMFRSMDSLSGNQRSVPYEISVLSGNVTDSLGVFTSGKRLTLTFYYSPADSLTQVQENSNSFKIYRYNAAYQKWILQGGYPNVTENKVVFEVNRAGIYSLFRNTDTSVPTIDVNVQDQEFTIGGYIAGNGVISLLLSDANGIDVIDNSIHLFLNGIAVPPEDYVISVNLENINRIPIKYQLNVGKGTHELKVDCRDLNGYYNTREIEFVVNDEFDVVNLANYPNPVLGRAQDPKNDGRTRFTYILTDGADNVNIKVYTISGRLVKTFSNLPVGVGYHEYPRTVYGWDCKDEWGYSLANGVYFYRITATQGGKKIEKVQKMAILK